MINLFLYLNWRPGLLMALLVSCVWIGCKPCNTPQKPPPPRPFAYTVRQLDSTLNGYILLAPYEIYYWRNGQLLILDKFGKVRFSRQLGAPVFCFRQWHLDCATYYSYIINDSTAYHVPQINLATGHVVILDSALRPIKSVHLHTHGDVVVNKGQDLDLHEFVMLDTNHYYILGAYEKQAANIPDSLHPAKGVRIVTPIIQEIVGDSVVFQWDGSQFPEFYAISTDQQHYSNPRVVHNYMHINALFVDPADSNLLVSFRNTNQILKLDRHTGAILWRLGGKNSDFPLTAGQVFLRQHHIQVIEPGHRMLLFDNGDSVLRQSSRILEFGLDETAHKVTYFHATTLPKPWSQYMGSVEKHANKYLICGGSSFYLLELDANTGTVLMDMELNQAVYRATTVTTLPAFDTSLPTQTQSTPAL